MVSVQKRIIEITVGCFMILGFLALVFLAFKVSGLTTYTSPETYYKVTAEFDNVGGLKVRAPVLVAGVWVGQVGSITLNPLNFRAKVTLLLRKGPNKFPIDTSANIYTQGLLGANYVSLTPGYSTTFLKEGDQIETTQPAIILEKLIGQFMFSLKNEKNK
jgi:phospholipid/cholesterol/gamma-HCH transport system substrate-binding protein